MVMDDKDYALWFMFFLLVDAQLATSLSWYTPNHLHLVPIRVNCDYEVETVKTVFRISTESVNSFRVSLQGFPGLLESLGC